MMIIIITEDTKFCREQTAETEEFTQTRRHDHDLTQGDGWETKFKESLSDLLHS